MHRLFAVLARYFVGALLALTLTDCHDTARDNPFDAASIPEVELDVSRGEEGATATLTWTRYAGAAPFAEYLILRTGGSPGERDTLDTQSGVTTVRLTVPKVDTLAVISDPDLTSFVDESLEDNATHVYRISVVNSGGLEATSRQSPPIRGPVGPRLAFYSDRDGNWEVYVMNVDGSNLVNLTNHPAPDGPGLLAWSPDGRKIAFTSERDGNREVYVMNADGSNPINLTNEPAIDSWPVWSPDGSKIAFYSSRDGNREVYVVNADGSNPVRLTNDAEHDHPGSWSPDGSKIAFHSKRDDNFEVYVMNADGSNPIKLTPISNFNFAPDWSPDGTKIALSPAMGAVMYS